MEAILHNPPSPERIWAVLIKLIEDQYQIKIDYTLDEKKKEESNEKAR